MSQFVLNQTVQTTTVMKKAKNRRRLNTRMFIIVFAFIGLTCAIFSKLFIQAVNINLSIEQQTIESQISTLQVENDALKVEIQSLNSRERVTNIASDAGLSLDQNNIVTVDDGQ